MNQVEKTIRNIVIVAGALFVVWIAVMVWVFAQVIEAL